MVWEYEIYSPISGKDMCPDLELLTCDTLENSEWLEFKFYDLVSFWNNQEDDTKRMLVKWLGVSHRVGSAICYCIISEKGKVLSRTTGYHLTVDEKWILTSKNISVINIAPWKPHLEVMTLVIFWMSMTPS